MNKSAPRARMRKNAARIVVVLVGLLALSLQVVFTDPPSGTVRDYSWFEVLSILLTSAVWLLLIVHARYVIVTPKLGYFAARVSNVFFILFFATSLAQQIAFRGGFADTQSAIVGLAVPSILTGAASWIAYTARRVSPHGSVPLVSPVRGDWFAMHGGGNRFVNYHQKVDAQAFAVDLAKLGPDGFSYACPHAATIWSTILSGREISNIPKAITS